MRSISFVGIHARSLNPICMPHLAQLYTVQAPAFPPCNMPHCLPPLSAPTATTPGFGGFGAPAASPATSLFGGLGAAAGTPGGLFGAPLSPQPAGGLFGAVATQVGQ